MATPNGSRLARTRQGEWSADDLERLGNGLSALHGNTARVWITGEMNFQNAFLCGYPISRGVPGWEAGEAASPDLPTCRVNGRIRTADETLI